MSVDGRPCFRLMVPTAKPIADFHRQVTAYAGRTLKTKPWNTRVSEDKEVAILLFFLYLYESHVKGLR